jgi:hypothetical protein
MKNSSTLTLELKHEEANMIIEALLFASSVNVGADWKEKDINKMISLSKKVKTELNGSTKLNNIVFYQEENYEDDWTQSVFNFFKNDLNVVSLQQA